MPTETFPEWQRRKGYEKLADDIASLPEADERDAVYGEVVLDPGFTILLDRDYAGLKVELRWYEDGEVAISLQEGEDKPHVFAVPPDKALDAYHHPYVYLPL